MSSDTGQTDTTPLRYHLLGMLCWLYPVPSRVPQNLNFNEHFKAGRGSWPTVLGCSPYFILHPADAP